MSALANFASTPRTAVAQVTVANTNRDGTGTVATVMTGAATGTRIDDIEITAVGATTAGMVRLFLHDGTSARLLREVPVPAITPSGTVPAFNFRQEGLGLVLQNGSWSLRATTHAAETLNVAVTRAGDF